MAGRAGTAASQMIRRFAQVAAGVREPAMIAPGEAAVANTKSDAQSPGGKTMLLGGTGVALMSLAWGVVVLLLNALDSGTRPWEDAILLSLLVLTTGRGKRTAAFVLTVFLSWASQPPPATDLLVLFDALGRVWRRQGRADTGRGRRSLSVWYCAGLAAPRSPGIACRRIR